MSPTTRATPPTPGTPPTRAPSGRSRSSSERRRRAGGWCTARPRTAGASRSALPAGTPRSTPSCSSPRGWPAARLRVMAAATRWAAGLAAAVVLGPCLAIQIRRAWAALVRQRQARRRAEALLWAWLSPAQRKQYRARRWFEVTTASGRRYRILRGRVVRLDPRGSGFCIEATSPVPVADEMLANMLLETDERRFLATAHRFPYRSFSSSELGL